MKVEPLQWNEECEVVFNQVKEVLSEIAYVNAPDFAQMFYVNPSFGPDAVGVIFL